MLQCPVLLCAMLHSLLYTMYMYVCMSVCVSVCVYVRVNDTLHCLVAGEIIRLNHVVLRSV